MNLFYDKVNLTIDHRKYYLVNFNGKILNGLFHEKVEFNKVLPLEGYWIKVKACIDCKFEDGYLKISRSLSDKIRLHPLPKTDYTHIFNMVLNMIYPNEGYSLHLLALRNLGIKEEDYNTKKLGLANSIFKGDSLKEKVDYYIELSTINENFQEKQIFKNLIKEILIQELRIDGLILEHLPLDLIDDVDLVKEAINQNGMAIQFASDRLKNDEKIVELAINQNGMAIQFASDRLKNDEDIVYNSINRDGMAIQFASDELKNDLEFLLTAAKQNIASLQFTTKQQQMIIEAMIPRSFTSFILNSDLIINLLDKDVTILSYLPNIIKSNKHIVKHAVDQNGMAIQFASDGLKNDLEIVLTAAKQNIESLQFVCEPLRLLAKTIIESGLDYEVILKDHKHIILDILSENELIIQYLPLFFKADLETTTK